MIKQWLFALVLASSNLLLIACDGKQEPRATEAVVAKSIATDNNCHLRMGWDPWEPYQYLTPDDEVKGLEIDLVGAIAREAGCEVVFVQDNWVNLLNGIRNGSIDMLGGATRTRSREKFAHFSDNYRHESFLLYVRTGESENYRGKSLGELLKSGFRVGITQDYIYGEQVNELQDDEVLGKNFISVPITEVNYYNLTHNTIDGFLEDPFVAAYTIRRKGLQDQLEPLDIEIESGDVAIIFSRESVKPETVQAFNRALATLKETGEYREILTRHRY